MADETRYDVFLSYNSRDRVIVERVAEALEQRGCKCFLDQWYLTPGRDWVVALERALQTSRSVAVFVGPHEMGRWQQRERAWALDRLAEHDDFPVVPVLLPDCEPPLGFMKQLTWIDLRDDPANDAKLEALAAAIRGEPVDLDGEPQPRAMVCPYRGLLAFREEDADFFFGRDTYRDQLVELVERENFVAVVGASGSGKSSLVGAGLIPALRKQHNGHVWDVVRMVPDVDPLYSLAEVLVPLIEPELSGLDFEEKLGKVANDLAADRPNTPLWRLVNAALRGQPGTDRLLLFVDQWEELYTYGDEPERRQRFVAELLQATAHERSRLSVVLTVRSDFTPHLYDHRHLLDRLQNAELKLGPMTRDELRATIQGPAQIAALIIDEALIDLMLDEARDAPGRLPLLEFALEELWKRRERFELTNAAYHDLGRLKGAIATRAEAAYKVLREEEKQSLPQLFRQLVRVGEKTEEDTRRRAVLPSDDELQRHVVDKLATERLLVISSDGPSGRVIIEVAHEELLRQWTRLREWIDDDRQFLQWRRRLEMKVDDWRRYGDDVLLKGEPLREAVRFTAEHGHVLDENETDFIEYSATRELEAVLKSPEDQTQLAGALCRAITNGSGLLRGIFEQSDSSPLKIRCAITSWRLGQLDLAAVLMRPEADPSGRTNLIHQWSEWPCEAEQIIDVLDSGVDGFLSSALCCALGNSELESFAPHQDALISILKKLHREAHDAGTHSASGWALRRWQVGDSGNGSDPEWKRDDLTQKCDWMTNSLGMTMLRIPAGGFIREGHCVNLSEFWLADRQVSVGQFLRFTEDQDLDNWAGYDEKVSPSPDHPIQQVSWLQAVVFCNWLSHQEGLQSCYDEGTWELDFRANGYRLPTEAEWEYACRAGTSTEYCFGDEEDLLSEYAVHGTFSTEQCGSRLPNACGLFDMHGNVWEWCYDRYGEFESGPSTDPIGRPVGASRVLRGGSFNSNNPQNLRSADRDRSTRDRRNNVIGFRLSRTP